MRKKLISKTYLRDINKYTLNIYLDKEDYYLCVKKFIDVEKPFISVSSGLPLIDNQFYLVEVLPKNKNYTMRVYFNEKKERILYYFDITMENGLDEETKIPFYDDLYLDVVLSNNGISVLDEDELLDALNNKSITKDDFHLANNTKDQLIKSIKNKTNKYMKLDLESYLH